MQHVTPPLMNVLATAVLHSACICFCILWLADVQHILTRSCNMEGVSNEAASLAGHWGLGKLIAFYDDNQISIDGNTEISFTEDVSARYVALGWQVLHVKVRHGKQQATAVE